MKDKNKHDGEREDLFIKSRSVNIFFNFLMIKKSTCMEYMVSVVTLYVDDRR